MAVCDVSTETAAHRTGSAGVQLTSGLELVTVCRAGLVAPRFQLTAKPPPVSQGSRSEGCRWLLNLPSMHRLPPLPLSEECLSAVRWVGAAVASAGRCEASELQIKTMGWGKVLQVSLCSIPSTDRSELKPSENFETQLLLFFFLVKDVSQFGIKQISSFMI